MALNNCRKVATAAKKIRDSVLQRCSAAGVAEPDELTDLMRKVRGAWTQCRGHVGEAHLRGNWVPLYTARAITAATSARANTPLYRRCRPRRRTRRGTVTAMRARTARTTWRRTAARWAAGVRGRDKAGNWSLPTMAHECNRHHMSNVGLYGGPPSDARTPPVGSHANRRS